jgi:hypothetical protein
MAWYMAGLRNGLARTWGFAVSDVVFWDCARLLLLSGVDRSIATVFVSMPSQRILPDGRLMREPRFQRSKELAYS